MAFRFQLRRDTAALWAAINPILLIGELAYETDTNKLKIGDGTNAWNALPYFLDSVDSVNGKAGVVVLNTDDIAEPGATAFNKWFTPQRVANTILGGENIQLSYSTVTEKLTITSPGNIKFPEGIGLTAGQPLPVLDEYGTTGSFYIGLTSASSLYRLGIGTTGPRAVLEVNSIDSGIVFPRLTDAQKNAIVSPIVGMVIYNTTTNKLNLWDGTKWAPAGGGLKLEGDADLQQQPLQVQDASDNGSNFYLGATAQGFFGNVGFGTTGPVAALHIESTTSGILLPRMTRYERDAIGATAGLVIYQTDFTEGAYQYKTTGWEPIDPGDISGTANHVARFTANSVISNGSIYDDGTAVSIGASGADPSAIFQVSSTTRGFLAPKMTTIQRNGIVVPATGLLIYNTDDDKLNLWDGSKWAPAGGGLKLAGDADLDVIPLQVQDASDGGSSFYLGSNSQYFTGNVGFGGDFGITGPQAALEIRTTTSGILLPRMSKAQRDLLTAIQGLVIYQTDEVEGAYQYKNTTGWEPIDPGDISGTAGRVARFVDNSIINNSSIFDDGENVWIGPTGSTGSSIFSVQSTTKGVAIPLMTTVQKEAIPTPADGLLVTESGTTGGLNQYIQGVGWVQYLHDNAGLTGGTQVISGNLVIEGTLSAEAKSFRIDNPERPGHKLVYGVAEGPEHSVFFRGRSRNNRIEMPEEWKWLVDGRSITVQLTPIGKWSRLAVDRIENGIIYIKDQSPWSWFKKRQKLHFFYFVQAERKDIQKLDPNP